jgi:hypothetical protein
MIAPELSVGTLQPMGNAINVNFVNLTSPQVATRSIAALRRGDQYANQLFSCGGNWIRPVRYLIGLPMPGDRPRHATVRLGRVEIQGRRLSIDTTRVRMMTPPGRFVARMMTNSVKSVLRSSAKSNNTGTGAPWTPYRTTGVHYSSAPMVNASAYACFESADGSVAIELSDVI